MISLETQKKCSKCEQPVYASYKNRYFCATHLKEFLKEEKEEKKGG